MRFVAGWPTTSRATRCLTTCPVSGAFCWRGNAGSTTLAGPASPGRRSTEAAVCRCRASSSGSRSTPVPTVCRPAPSSWDSITAARPCWPAGSEEQRSAYLAPIFRGDLLCCQGFSEPGSGSDLAGVRTRGDIDGDELVVNGQKIWTSFGQVSVLQELVVRTDAGSTRHRGLTWIICDMRLPGITIRPITNMAGDQHFCEVFYDNVRRCSNPRPSRTEAHVTAWMNRCRWLMLSSARLARWSGCPPTSSRCHCWLTSCALP